MHVALQHGLDDAVGEHDAARIQGIDVDASGAALEETDQIHHLDARHLAVENFLDGKVAAPIGDGDDDLVRALRLRERPERAL